MNKINEQIKPILCPRCKSMDIHLREWIHCYTDWCPEYVSKENIGYHEPADYYRITGVCGSCTHIWKIRNEIQITDELKDRLRVNYKRLNK